MMQRLADDPAFWLAVSAFLGFAYTWAKTKTAELEARSAQLEARSAQGTAQSVAEGQGAQQQTLVQHTAAIAALQATSQATGDGRQATVAPVVPAAPATAPVAPIAGPLPPTASSESTAPGGGLIVPDGG